VVKVDTEKEPAPVPKRSLLMTAALAALGTTFGACAPTIHVKVDPISINAKLDADVRIKLDKEVQALIQQNPNLF
jgi:hypothetical protein